MLSTRLWRAFVRNIFRAPRTLIGTTKTRRRLRLNIENLEDRVVPSIDTWTATGGGNWDVGSNWSLGNAPASSDTAVIDLSGTATITIKSGDNITVQSVNVE